MSPTMYGGILHERGVMIRGSVGPVTTERTEDWTEVVIRILFGQSE